MVYSYRFHPLIKEDFNEAYIWYEDKQKGLGEQFLIEVRKKIEAIASNPQAYSAKEKKSFRQASIGVFPYLIVYKINKSKKEIYVSSIHHMKKHPFKKFRKQ